jgi:YfiH family protein
MPQPIRIDALSALPGLAHGFFTREGGVSEGIYASLNCGVGSQDSPAAAHENRARVVRCLGGRTLVSAYQVHGTTVAVMDERPPAERPKADGLVTATPGVAVGVLTADCAPILFADAEAKVVGAAHAGWRGALAGIAEATVDAMERLGAARHRIHAAVGPCIGAQVYEVGPEFEAQFMERDPAAARFFSRAAPQGRPHFDLSGYVVSRVRQAGVAGVSAANVCNYTLEGRFFSYRRSQQRGEPDYGRQISAIVLT